MSFCGERIKSIHLHAIFFILFFTSSLILLVLFISFFFVWATDNDSLICIFDYGKLTYLEQAQEKWNKRDRDFENVFVVIFFSFRWEHFGRQTWIYQFHSMLLEWTKPTIMRKRNWNFWQKLIFPSSIFSLSFNEMAICTMYVHHNCCTSALPITCVLRKKTWFLRMNINNIEKWQINSIDNFV